jgi:hypothetical protein
MGATPHQSDMAIPDYAQIEKLALDIARDVAGPENVARVRVKPDVTFDGHPAYSIYVYIDPAPLTGRLGHLRLGLLRGLRDTLDERGDDHEVIPWIEDRADLLTESTGA